MGAVQLCYRISFVLEQVASRARAATTALRTLSSVALGSLRTPKSLCRIFLVSFFLGWAASLVQNKSLILSASFAQRDSFESSLPSLCLSSFCVAASSPASERASTAASSMSFKHEQVMAMLLANEAYSLPPALLQHSLKAKLVDKELRALSEELDAKLFEKFIPKLGESTSLTFWLMIHEEALQAFKETSFDILPPQKASSKNANLGNWQLSSSPAKQISFWAWCTNRHAQLGEQKAYLMSFELEIPSFSAAVAEMELGQTVSLDHRGQDCQLVFWGKLAEGALQPSLQKLQVKLSEYIFEFGSFASIEELFTMNSFDWGGASSGSHLALNWKLDAQVHKHVYKEACGPAWRRSSFVQAYQEGACKPNFRRSSFQRVTSFGSFLESNFQDASHELKGHLAQRGEAY